MCAFYIVRDQDKEYVKIGHWQHSERELLSRYIMYLGDKIDILYFASEQRIKVESSFKTYFATKCVGGERFDNKFVNEYIEYLNTVHGLKFKEISKATMQEQKINNKHHLKIPSDKQNLQRICCPVVPKQREKCVHTCLVCGYVTQYNSHMKKHLKSILPCGGVMLDDPNYLKMVDIYIDGNKPNKEEPVYKCDLCLKRFKSRTSIYHHRKICDGIKKISMFDQINLLKTEVEMLKLASSMQVVEK